MTDSPESLLLGSVSVDPVRGVVQRPDGEQRLTELEVRLLRCLHGARGQPVPREQLQQQVWGHQPNLSTRAVDMAVSRLRKKLGDPDLLRSVRGDGYRLVPSAALDPAEVLRLVGQLTSSLSLQAADGLRRLADRLETDHPDPATCAAAVLGRATLARLDGSWAERLACLEEGVAGAASPHDRRLRLELGRALANHDRPRATALLSALAAEVQGPLRGEALWTLAWSLRWRRGPHAGRDALPPRGAFSGELGRRIDCSRDYFDHLCGEVSFEATVEALEAHRQAFLEVDQLDAAVRTSLWIARLQRNDGDLQGARATRAIALEQQAQLADRVLEGALVTEAAFDAAHERDFEAALRHFDRATDIHGRVEPVRVHYLRSCRGLVRLELRRYDDARQDLEAVAAWAKAHGRLAEEQHNRKTLALLHLDQGLAERAVRVARSAVALAERAGDAFQRDTARMHLAAALGRMGRGEQAWSEYEAIDAGALPLGTRAVLLARWAALAARDRPDALPGLLARLRPLLEHGTVPDRLQLAQLVDALSAADRVCARGLLESGDSVEVRVVARLVLDAC